MKYFQDISWRKVDTILLSLILLLAFTVRLYNIQTPLADFHSFRQVDTAAVARNFARDGFNLLSPRYDDLSSIQSQIDNPQGYRFVEFPLYNAIFGMTFKLLPFIPLEVWGRLTTALSSLIIISVLYYFCLKESGRISAIGGALVYSVFPFFVFFSRVVLPETISVAFAFLGLFILYRFLGSESRLKNIFGELSSALLFSLALLIKPYTIFYLLPALYLFISRYKKNSIKHAMFYIYFAIVFIPFGLWRYYIQTYPEGIPSANWLITSVNTYQGLQNIFLRPAFFRWVFYERISTIILGGYATFFLLLGFMRKHKTYFPYMLLFSAFAFLFVFQGGNVQHEYYQTIILPVIAFFCGSGIEFVFDQRRKTISSLFLALLVVFVFVLSAAFSYYRVREYYSYPEELVQIANVVNTLTKPTDLIVTDREGDTTLLYLMDRKGAPAVFRDPPLLKENGYQYLVTLNLEYAEDIKRDYNLTTIFKSDKFVMFKL